MRDEPGPDYASDDVPTQLTRMLDEGRTEEVIDFCTRALRADPVQGSDAWRGYYLARRGHARMCLRHYPRAIADLERAVELIPTVAFTAWLGEAYSRDGRYDAAIGTFERLLAAGPSEGFRNWISLELATAERASGRIGDALATVERYRDRGESYKQHRLLRYEILLHLNPGLWAKEASMRAGDADSGLALLVAARAAAAQGDHKEAKRIWKKALEWYDSAPLAHPFWRRVAEAHIK